jgi:hypothetical protein
MSTIQAKCCCSIKPGNPYGEGGPLMKPCDENIRRMLRLIEQMIQLADQGDSDREDTGCGILYGVLRDSAYKLKRMAEEEKEKHIVKGWWIEE